MLRIRGGIVPFYSLHGGIKNMIYILNLVLVTIVVVETTILVFGKETAKKIWDECLQEISGSNQINFLYGLYDAEANDFIGCMRNFFRNITLSDYRVDQIGWIYITYTINGMIIKDKESIRKAICIELHSYLLENHGIDYWGYYVPVITEDKVLIRIAASPGAEKQLKNLIFRDEREKAKNRMEE